MNDVSENHTVDDNVIGSVAGIPKGDSPGLSVDVMEVENEKYHEKVAFILPLSSGRFAVLTPQRRLYQIVDALEEAVGLAPRAYEADRQTRKREDLVQQYASSIMAGEDLLKELGL